MLIGLVGLIGSGKNTAADYLIQKNNFKSDSFAKSLKDVAATVFGWDRDALEGNTVESRKWRETVNVWWAEKLEIAELTPRWVLQNIGTELFRRHFHNDIWVYSLEKRILDNINSNVVVTDCRFPNEIDIIRRLNGKIIQIRRGENPSWWNQAKFVVEHRNNEEVKNLDIYLNYLKELREKIKIHESEYMWANSEIDYIVQNDGSIDDLYLQIQNILNNLK